MDCVVSPGSLTDGSSLGVENEIDHKITALPTEEVERCYVENLISTEFEEATGRDGHISLSTACTLSPCAPNQTHSSSSSSSSNSSTPSKTSASIYDISDSFKEAASFPGEQQPSSSSSAAFHSSIRSTGSLCQRFFASRSKDPPLPPPSVLNYLRPTSLSSSKAASFSFHKGHINTFPSSLGGDRPISLSPPSPSQNDSGADAYWLLVKLLFPTPDNSSVIPGRKVCTSSDISSSQDSVISASTTSKSPLSSLPLTCPCKTRESGSCCTVVRSLESRIRDFSFLFTHIEGSQKYVEEDLRHSQLRVRSLQQKADRLEFQLNRTTVEKKNDQECWLREKRNLQEERDSLVGEVYHLKQMAQQQRSKMTGDHLSKETDLLSRELGQVKAERDRYIGETYLLKSRLCDVKNALRQQEDDCEKRHLPKLADLKRIEQERTQAEQELISTKLKYAQSAYDRLEADVSCFEQQHGVPTRFGSHPSSPRSSLIKPMALRRQLSGSFTLPHLRPVPSSIASSAFSKHFIRKLGRTSTVSSTASGESNGQERRRKKSGSTK